MYNKNTVVSIPLYLKSVSCSEICSLGFKMCPLTVVSCLKLLTVYLEPVSNPMVFCFLPGTRPASVAFCMTACRVTDNTGLNLCTLYNAVSVAIEMLLSSILLIGLMLSFMFEMCVGFCRLVVLLCTCPGPALCPPFIPSC